MLPLVFWPGWEGCKSCHPACVGCFCFCFKGVRAAEGERHSQAGALLSTELDEGLELMIMT